MDAFVKRLPKPDVIQPSKSPAPADDGLAESPRPQKRRKQDVIPDSEEDSEGELGGDDDEFTRHVLHEKSAQQLTDFENALPDAQDDEEAIREYENFKLSQEAEIKAGNGSAEKIKTTWVRGRSSIYVDAFNLALDTVLEEESHLFDAKEEEVFRQWRELHYEAQFMYVRLFLRKTDAWHRSTRLNYYSDVSDPEKAVETLQQLRTLPDGPSSDTHASTVDSSGIVLEDTFTFADKSEDHFKTVAQAASLLSLDELKAVAKEAKVQGKNKADLVKALCRMTQKQAGLMSLGLSRHNSREGSIASEGSESPAPKSRAKLRREDSNREQHFLTKILEILGPCVRLSPAPFKLFERVHLVFYRSTEWTEKSLTTIILAKIARRNFPEYLVCRTSTIFASRAHLLEFESGIRLEAEVDRITEFGEVPGEAGFQRIFEIFEAIYPRWKALIIEEEDKEQRVYEMGEGAYLRRFTPAHSYTRIIHKALPVFARWKEHAKEHSLLSELLGQRLFHMARRGAWYQRKALLEEHYMHALDENPVSETEEKQMKHWRKIAVATCEAGLRDPDCHLIYHYDLQKRLTKLEKKLRIPKREQHDFGHVRLADAEDITVEGIQLKRDVPVKPGRQAASTKTIWLDELDSGGECSVEEMCLSKFRQDGWKGYHAEGGIIRTLFAYLFYDVLFVYIPNVFQTAFQTCPLDLHTDAFFHVRASEINHRLVDIANGQGERIVRKVWENHHDRRTCVIGLKWDFDIEDIAQLVSCFEGSALAAVCKVMAQEYRQRGGGIPDLILWRPFGEDERSSRSGGEPGTANGEVMFAEVKSANDRLSDTQRLWIHVLTGAGVRVALCNAVAAEVREVD
ncbi:VRR-NUC domain-containing protein [Emericellopsis atlantica]|uniref:Fanconi-associated nuclease n=1 Tax=Emericellopsis atlantica TaxID=2614577 RepID=A0A9P7ZU49_9HYPO|nr:VRR-NUC domain-containing protein [Emericellopsis atlantica]KAG9257857.1 VRR-NUC domain-containing protein [Emericellopsis atlantica]